MQRKFLLLGFMLMFAMALFAPSLTPSQAQDGSTAVTNAELNVRATPNGSVIHRFSQNTTVQLIGRNAAGDWIFVRSMDNSISGWVARPYLTYTPADYNVFVLPEVNDQGSVIAAGSAPVPAPADATPAPVAAISADVTASNYASLNVRGGPGIGYSRLITLARNTPFAVEARNAGGDWVLINTGSIRGWVAIAYITVSSGNVYALPTSVETFDPATGGDNTTVISVPASANGSVEDMIARLESLPTFYNFNYSTLRSIHARGRANGYRANVFTKVGDSISASQPFLLGLGANDHNLGGYGYLQPTLDFFSVSPRDGQTNSWTNRSVAVASAFSAASVLDVIWADPNLCNPNEAPLLCEYRITRPSVVIIMLGSVDIQIYDIAQYTVSMRQILRLTTRAGIIPVVTTFPINPNYIYWEKSLQFNMVLLDLAQQYGAPVINLWKEARRLPNNGVGDDQFHLSQGPTFYNFTGEENLYGVTLRNLLTTQALDMLRQNVLQR